MKTWFLVVFLVGISAVTSAQSFVDSAVAKWNDKNLIILERNAHDLTDQVYKLKIQRKLNNPLELLETIALKSTSKAAQFSPEAQLIIYANLGEAFVKERYVAQGYVYLREARKLSTNMSGLPLAYFYSKYSEVFQDLNRLDSAISYSEKVLTMASNLGNDSLERVALEKIAFQCYRAANFSRSKVYFSRILENPSCSKTQRMNALNTIGLIYRNLRMYDSARVYYDSSMKVAISLLDTAWIGLLNGNIGHTYYLENKFDLAIPGLKKDYYYSKKVNSVESSIYALSTLLKVSTRLANFKEARIYFDSLTKDIELTSDRQIQSEYYISVADYFEKAGDEKNTIKYLRMYIAVQDSLKILRNGERTAELEAQFEFDRQARKYQELSNQTILQKEEGRRNRIVIISLIVITIIILITLLLLYKNYKIKRSTNLLLQTKNAEIHAQNESLQLLNETKNKLFSIIGHDLRGPINSLKGLLTVINRSILDPADLQKMMQQLERNVELIHFNLNNILYWANGQMQGIKADLKPVELRPVVDETIHFLNEMALSKEIAIVSKLTTQFLVKGDADLLRLVIRNLISNAIKFTNQGGRVEVDAQVKSDIVITSITDNGIGMSKEMAQHLFEDRYIKSQNGTAGEKGTGLGLQLCREMIDRMNGKIWVESEPGKGTTIYFSLPTARLA